MEYITEDVDQQVVLEEEIDENYEPTERGTDRRVGRLLRGSLPY